MASRKRVLQRTAGVSRRPSIGAYGSPTRGMTARPGRPGPAGPGDMAPRPQRPPPPPGPGAGGPGGASAQPRWHESCLKIGSYFLLDTSLKNCFQPPAGPWDMVPEGDLCPAGMVKNGQQAVKYRPAGTSLGAGKGGFAKAALLYRDVCVPGQK